jgi:Tfp pilus assembly PilM family ATPase
VIDGAKSSFFNRYVYFAAEDFVGQESGTSESEKRTQALAEEIARSLAFYEKSTFATGFQEILLLGEFLDTPGMAEKIKRQTGLAVRKMDIPRKMGLAHEMPPGRFDLALSLALRAGQD